MGRLSTTECTYLPTYLQRAWGPYSFHTSFNSVRNVVQPQKTWFW